MSGVRNILLIGASSEVGTEVIKAFLNTEASVVATYKNHRINIEDSRLTSVKLDLSSSGSMDGLIETVMTTIKTVDVVVFLAAILPGKSLAEYDDSEIVQVMATNFTNQAILLRKLLSLLANGSQILMMSSISAEKGSYDPLYAASKGALVSFVKSLAISLAPKTRVNAVAPSLIQGSTMFYEMTPTRREQHRQETPTKKLVKAADLAKIIVDISTPHWSSLNGVVVRINGGSYV